MQKPFRLYFLFAVAAFAFKNISYFLIFCQKTRQFYLLQKNLKASRLTLKGHQTAIEDPVFLLSEPVL